MLFIEEFTDELSNFIVESLNINNGNNKSKKLKEGWRWRDQLRTKIRTLADHYGGGNVSRSRGPSFIIGDETSSTTASITAESTTTPTMADAEVQVNLLPSTIAMRNMPPPRKSSGTAMGSAEDAQLLAEMRDGRLKHRQLEQRCAPAKAVELRRRHLEERHRIDLTALPYENYDYSEVKDACCENVIGTMPLPTGIAGPLLFDGGELVPIPLSTTEGALVASVSRGCLALNESVAVLGTNAFYVEVVRDGMSRAPVLEFDRLKEASACFEWIQREGTFGQLKRSFDETSSYASLQRVDPHLEGNLLFLRFVAKTGDAMGMNMVTKGTSRALALVRREFPGARLLSISGNFCVDKKPSALNWIEGRGKSVVAEAFLPAQIVERVLKTSVERLIKLGHAKLLVGSSAACTVAGGWNAHAANVVAAMFLATGQDAAQVVSSSMCLTQLGRREEDGALRISCTMNCLEVGTVGGGTVLSPQSACLEMLGCRRSGLRPGQNAERLARLICSTVMAGELSLLASQCNEGDLEKTHLRLNRSSRNLVLSNSAYPLSNAAAAPSNSSHHLLLLGSPCKKSSSIAAIPQAIPEHLPFSSAAEPTKTFSNAFSGKTMTGQIEKKKEKMEGTEDNRTRADTKTSSASTTASSNVGRDHRTRSTLSQASAKLVKKASSGHHIMPCGPL